MKMNIENEDFDDDTRKKTQVEDLDTDKYKDDNQFRKSMRSYMALHDIITYWSEKRTVRSYTRNVSLRRITWIWIRNDYPISCTYGKLHVCLITPMIDGDTCEWMTTVRLEAWSSLYVSIILLLISFVLRSDDKIRCTESSWKFQLYLWQLILLTLTLVSSLQKLYKSTIW